MANSNIFTTTIFFFLIIILRVGKLNLPHQTFDCLWKIAILKALLPEFQSKLSIYNYLHLQKAKQNLYISQVEITPRDIETSTNFLNIKLLVYWSIFFIIFLIIVLDYVKAYNLVRATTFEFNIKIDRFKVKVGYGNVNSPVQIGIIRHYIILPHFFKDNIERKELELILKHEILHIKRADNFWRLISILVIAKYWYNPILWFGILMFFKDIEICVDLKLLKLTKVEPYFYANLLLSTARLAQSQSRYNLFSNFTKLKSLNERLVCIMNYKKKSLFSVLIACILVTSVTTACATSKVTTQEVSSSNGSINSTDILTEHGLKSEETHIITEKNQNFILKNGCALIFTKEKDWNLAKGDKAVLEILLSDTKYNIEVGYMKDNGKMVPLFSGLPENASQSFDFSAPDDGNFAFYLLGISSDAIKVKQVDIM